MLIDHNGQNDVDGHIHIEERQLDAGKVFQDIRDQSGKTGNAGRIDACRHGKSGAGYYGAYE